MVEKLPIIAIIPARGGSKRILKKNTIDFFGKPLIAHTIEAAISSKIFSRVVVSTDDEEIAVIAKQYGAAVPFIRDAFTDDLSPVSQATIYTIEKMNALEGTEYAVTCQLMPNCPLRTTNDITAAYKHFSTSGSKFQISGFRYGWMNPWWAHQLEGKNWKPLFPDAWQQRSQDLPALYCPTGAIWLANTASLLKAGTFYGQGYEFCELPWQSAVDIDTMEDLEMAKAVFLAQHHNAQ